MRKREVWAADSTSEEPAKISTIQSMTGIHPVTEVRVVLFN